MSSRFVMGENEGLNQPLVPGQAAPDPLRIEELSNRNETEVLAFLTRRPVHTILMAGLIRDNGLVSSSNRGTFFGCRNTHEQLEGVALIGQKTVVETSSTSALETLGRLPPDYQGAHLVRGEEQQIERLVEYYAAVDRRPRLVRREILLELLAPAQNVETEPNLRLANGDDLAIVTSINAGMAAKESEINPMTKDPQGMLERTELRIARGRVWILTQNGQTIFKADVIFDTPQLIFLEGVFVRWQERRKGHGLRCMTQLARNLLTESKSLCLVVNEDNSQALAYYNKAGFKVTSRYNTAYFSAL